MTRSDLLARRRFLVQTGGLLALTYARPATVWSAPRFSGNPFTLGVASGDPTPDGVVLWTRLAPDPLQGGGMGNDTVKVQWRVASDDKMQRVVKKGSAEASPDLAHSVHVDVSGLQPGRHYWYQFSVGNEESPIGRTRTAPAANQPLDKLTFGFASCSHWEAGHFTAYRHMAEENLDFAIHLGDYIYEGPGRDTGVRKHAGPEIMTLSDYRTRHAQYKTDPNLQRVHLAFPWLVTWDDHEVDNNYADDKEENGMERGPFMERRAHAYQAYYEHMPLRRSSLPQGTRMQLYRRLAFGDLAAVHVLDTRQYRTDQPCDDGNKPQCPAALAEKGTLLGPDQERWLLDGLGKSRGKWNILAQQVMIAKVDRKAGPEEAYALDQWSGYEAARTRMLNYFAERKPSNPVVITGDIHTNWVADLKRKWTDEKDPILGTEFVGTSITSGGDGADMNPAVKAYLPENPHVRFFNGQRGYVRCQLTQQRWQADYRVMAYVSRPDGPISTRASFVVEAGQPGAKQL